MKEKLTNNLGLKFLSIALAIIGWFMVVDVVNPLVEGTVEVPVEMINEDILTKADLTYEVVGKKSVTVTYQVRSRDRYRIKSSDFYASADLANLYDVTGSIPVNIEIANREIRAMIEGTPETKPGVVRIQTEELQRKGFDIIPRISGEVEEGYAIGATKVSPEQIYVTGPVSVVGQISSVGIEIDMSGASGDVTGGAGIMLYDANGNQQPNLMDEVSLSRSEAEYQVNILKVKTLGLDFQITGEVATGYRFTGVDSDIRSVPVEGLKSVLASVSTLVIPGDLLNIQGATADVTVEVDLAKLLPDNISITKDVSSIATVTMRVEPLVQRNLTFDTDGLELLGASEEFEYQFLAEKANVRIQGLAEDLDSIGPGSVSGRVDVTGLEEGTATVEIQADLPEGFEWVGSDRIQLSITRKGEEGPEGPDGDEIAADESETTGEEEGGGLW